VAPARAEPAEPEPERVPHGKGAAKTASSAGTSSKKSGKFDDPFASDGETANEPKPAAVSGKAKAAASEPAPRPTAKSNDSLDNLMADGVADSKGKKRDSKDLDALLKDVQKSKPEPKAKHEDSPPPAAALSPSDISRVMAGVKTRSNDCAHRLGQKGNAELKITVGKDGHVSDVSLGGNVANTPLGACIEKVTRAAVFPASSGLRFDYRMEAR
jgi:outer membrane biosynthesis protein TonB